MLYLLIGIAICLLVPWLPVLLLRLEPLRPPPPLSQEEMERLRARLYGRLSQSPARTKSAEQIRQGAAAPQTIEDQSAAPSEEGLKRLTLQSYRWTNFFVSVAFIVSMLGMAIVWAFVFHFLGEARARSLPTGVFVFKPAIYGIIFAVPAIFLGIFSSMGIMEVFTRLLLGRRYTEYSHWSQARLGKVRQQRIGRRFFFFAWFLGGLMALWVLLAMNWYVRLSDDEIALKPLFGVREQVYPYPRVQQIVYTSHVVVQKESIPHPGLHLRFDDGNRWSTGQTFVLPDDPAEQKRLLDFLTRKTGKPLIKPRSLEDLPGW